MMVFIFHYIYIVSMYIVCFVWVFLVIGMDMLTLSYISLFEINLLSTNASLISPWIPLVITGRVFPYKAYAYCLHYFH